MTKDNEKIRAKHGKFFLSRKFRDFEAQLKWIARTQLRKKYPDYKMLTGPIMVHVKCCFKNQRHPDCFNLPKSICDAMQEILYKNDRQIMVGISTVLYGDKEFIKIGVSPYGGNT